MLEDSKPENHPDRGLDVLTSRWAAGFAFVVVFFVAIASYGMVRDGSNSAQKARELFSGPSVRETAIALSDIFRLRHAVDRAVSDGGFTDETLDEFSTALDILFVRTDNFERNLAIVPRRVDSEAALAALKDIIDTSDAAIVSNFNDLQGFAAYLAQASRRANSALATYMNALNDDQVVALEGSVSSLTKLTKLHNGFLFALIAFTLLLQTLLRREVLNRRRRSEAEKKVAFLAFHDPLTGLRNRTAFNELIQSYYRAGPDAAHSRAALAFIDMDDFKEINDVYGHWVGDEALKRVGSALERLSPQYDAQALRVAGDEFAVLLPLGDPDTLIGFANDVLQEVSHPLFVEGQILHPSVSIGIAATDRVAELGEVSAQSMARSADFALFEAKRMAGSGNVRLFDDALAGQFTLRRNRLSALAAAIENQGLEVWLQPQINLNSLELLGFEALARWRFEGQMIPPDEFIKLAEEGGLIVDLDRYMLRSATRIVAEWNAAHGMQATVSVNISGAHINSPTLFEAVRDALVSSSLRPELLTLELTETVQVGDWESVGQKLMNIAKLGCRFAIDDFGSGYSSLGYLRNMPAHELKIDRSLVVGLEASQEGRSILTSVVDIAHALKFDTVVEGIETMEQADIARQVGCVNAQGYLFSRPLPHHALPAPDAIFPDTVIQPLRATLEDPNRHKILLFEA